MNATERRERAWGSNGALPTIAALAVVAFMLLLPGAVAVLGATHGATSNPTGGTSGLSAAWDKPVDFVETGLPSGTEWSVTLSGTLHSSNTTTVAFSEIPAIYPFTVTPVVGYTATPASGNVTVTSCMGATVDITFTAIPTPSQYPVFFNETGLAPGSMWWVDLAGNNTSSTSNSIQFSELNGTYIFTAPAIVSGPAGVQFVTGTNNGTVVVSGAEVTIAVPYSTEYYLTTGASPLAGGNATPGSGWYPAGAFVALEAIPAPGYSFLTWNGSGTGNYSGTNATPTVTMDSPIQEIATFGLSYAVDFEEIGLLDGVVWGVTFNGVTLSAFFVFLDFTAVNGTYAYNVTPIPGYHADSYKGNVTVAGSDITVTIHWVRVTYNVTFVESGLPTGTPWSVTLNGSEEGMDSTMILFLMSNGTYTWGVTPISGYTANVTGGTVVVNGSAVEVLIGWSQTAVKEPVAYTVTFVETGLIAGTPWKVTLNGTSSTTANSSTDSIEFTGLPDGTYAYWVPAVGAYLPAVSHQTVVVTGANVTVPVSFTTTGTSTPTPSTVQISVWDLLILAFITGGGIVVTWVIFRRS